MRTQELMAGVRMHLAAQSTGEHAKVSQRTA
jgi:hypothetical protein